MSLCDNFAFGTTSSSSTCSGMVSSIEAHKQKSETPPPTPSIHSHSKVGQKKKKTVPSSGSGSPKMLALLGPKPCFFRLWASLSSFSASFSAFLRNEGRSWSRLSQKTINSIHQPKHKTTQNSRKKTLKKKYELQSGPLFLRRLFVHHWGWTIFITTSFVAPKFFIQQRITFGVGPFESMSNDEVGTLHFFEHGDDRQQNLTQVLRCAVGEVGWNVYSKHPNTLNWGRSNQTKSRSIQSPNNQKTSY